MLALIVGPATALDAQQTAPLRPLTVTGIEGGVPRAPGPQAPVAGVQGAGQQQPPLAPAPVTRLDERQIHPELDGQRFSLSFSEPRPIIDILRLLVADTSLSLIPDPALDQTFIGELKNVTLREALDLMLEPLGLDYSVQGNVVRVFIRQLETRLYSIDRVITQRVGNRGMSASTGAGGTGVGGVTAAGGVTATGATGGIGTGTGGSTGAGGGSSSTVGGSDGPDLFGELEEGIRALLSTDGTFSLNETAALLQVTDRTSRLDLIEQYVETVMLRSLRQVQIEARVIEVELRDEFSAGVNWQVLLGDLTDSVRITQSLAPATSGAFTLALNVGDFSALLNAFATQGKVNVLSSPRVTAMNNEPAVMRIGTQDVFFTTTTQVNPDTGQILQTTVTPQSITEGVVLSVTSQVSADGVINMSINPSITERTGVATSRLGDTVPIISVREADTIVRVREGETIVIAGLMQDRNTTDNTKVPVLGDIPVIGHAFKSTSTRRTKTDLVILLTPTVMGPAQVTDRTARELRRLDTAGKASERNR
jgi:MSHA type pilus biogenesis protein MshL